MIRKLSTIIFLLLFSCTTTKKTTTENTYYGIPLKQITNDTTKADIIIWDDLFKNCDKQIDYSTEAYKVTFEISSE
jgi:hypothetical protein